MSTAIHFGIDHFLATAPPTNQRWGLVTNDAATTRTLHPVRTALLAAGFRIVRLFSPEHGMAACGADGAAMPHATDALTGLPIVSLYGTAVRPAPADLRDLDGIIFDLPDVGVRFYTYIWTLSYLLEVCQEQGLPLVVLDRPNPLSGDFSLAEGPLLDEGQAASFLGRWAIPVRHCLTVGELALFWQATRGLAQLDLTVIPAQGWQRHQFFQDLGLPFVPPSPAISCVESLLTYPTLCLFEGLNLSEGRGTAFPFRVGGAPWLDGLAMAADFNAINLAGVIARPFAFTPMEGLYQGESCGGIMLHVTDRMVFRPVQAGLWLVALLKARYPSQLKWRKYPTLVNKTGENHFDLLTGSPLVRQQLESNLQVFHTQIPGLTQAEGWRAATAPFLIYE
jgi:uncharacterized protein YbbC (DUF1343 family)